MNTWEIIKRQLESRLSTDSYQNWVSKTEFSHIQDDRLCVAVPNEETRVWLDSEYSTLVNSMLREMGIGLSGVVYELLENGTTPRNLTKDDMFSAPRTQLNPKYTFENFVVGACNEFAHAAAKSVATSPSRWNNPLSSYSIVSMIMPPLMHALARTLLH